MRYVFRDVHAIVFMATTDRAEASRQFTTGVAYITTHGSRGPNVMSAEWTYNVSYDPFLISVHLGPRKATHDAIVETGEFGVNLVPEDQVTAMAFAGHFSRHDVEKLSSDLFETYEAKEIRAPMIRGCLLNAECRLVQQVPMGDHTAFVGEVVAFSVDPSKRPLVLHKGARRLGARIRRKASVALAGTYRPMDRNRPLGVVGELTAGVREHKTVRVTLLDPTGKEVTRAAAKTDTRGRFALTLSLPASVMPGRYTLLGRYRQAVGRCQVEVE